MKRLDFIIIAVALAVVAFYGGHWLGSRNTGGHAHDTASGAEDAVLAQQYTCGMHPMIVTDDPGLCPICGMELTPLKSGTAGTAATGERKIKYWVAPMDPTYIRDEPGKSPMGMDLVPVYEDQTPGGSVISIDPVTAQNMGIRTEVTERRDLKRTVRTVGLVEYEDPSMFTITPKIGGWVERLYINEVGQQVGKGAPLLDIYSPDLVSAQEEFLLALENREALAGSSIRAIADGADRLLEASRRRLMLWDVSDRQIARLEETRQVRKTLTLFAPYPGIVTGKSVVEGAYVKPGMELLKVADISKVWVLADIYEQDLEWVKAGQPAAVELPFLAGRAIEATIDYLYPYVDPRTRTVKARINLENPGFELKPDMFVNVMITADVIQDTLAVPAEAILDTGEKQTVFVALGDGKFEPRLVKTGAQGDDAYVAIEQGLFDDERIVVSGQFMLDSESQVREAIRKMSEPDPVDGISSGDDLDDLFSDEEGEDLDALFEDDK